jgi:hypothetical protein
VLGLNGDIPIKFYKSDKNPIKINKKPINAHIKLLTQPKQLDNVLGQFIFYINSHGYRRMNVIENIFI